jgi:hypothetical protein
VTPGARTPVTARVEDHGALQLLHGNVRRAAACDLSGLELLQRVLILRLVRVGDVSYILGVPPDGVNLANSELVSNEIDESSLR